MNRYTFRTPNREVSDRIHAEATVTVTARDEGEARHLAMVQRWGEPRYERFPFSSELNRFYGMGLILEEVEPITASPQE